MKRTGVLNRDISEVIAGMGHGDFLVIADAGLPIPLNVRRIDLAVSPGIPSFMQVVRAVLTELQVEAATVASEISHHSPDMLAQLKTALGDAAISSVDHETFKQRTINARAIVRTGEFSPYANVILISGVVF